jgi:ABC-type phosphate/phosphonate transport system permease subunit
MMRKLCIGLAAVVLGAVPALLFATEGLDVPEALEKTVSQDGLTGISLFFARAYNENTWLYALYCTVTMAVVGMVIAFVTDLVLKAIGIEVHKIEHKE